MVAARSPSRAATGHRWKRRSPRKPGASFVMPMFDCTGANRSIEKSLLGLNLLAVSARDLDLPRLGLLATRQRDREDAVLERRLDVVGVHVGRQAERPLERSERAFRPAEGLVLARSLLRLLTPNGQHVVLD